VVAPFLLQVDAFSCRDAPDFNSAVKRILNVHGGLQIPVDVQALKLLSFALSSLLPTSPAVRTVGKR
jgi:hypothetical protein